MHNVMTTEFWLQFHNGAKLFEELAELLSPYIEKEQRINQTESYVVEIMYTSCPMKYLEHYVIPFIMTYNKMSRITGHEITIHYSK